jgi:hypothetical protein
VSTHGSRSPSELSQRELSLRESSPNEPSPREPSPRKLFGVEQPREPARRKPVPPVGLCETCVHRQLVPNTRGSVFYLCGRSRTEPQYERYPRLPVLKCPGYARPAGA